MRKFFAWRSFIAREAFADRQLWLKVDTVQHQGQVVTAKLEPPEVVIELEWCASKTDRWEITARPDRYHLPASTVVTYEPELDRYIFHQEHTDGCFVTRKDRLWLTPKKIEGFGETPFRSPRLR